MSLEKYNKYIPIEKEVIKIDKDDKESTVTIWFMTIYVIYDL